MGYLCPKCGREVSGSNYMMHVNKCKKTPEDYAEQDAESRCGSI
jgi:hypothetical protein